MSIFKKLFGGLAKTTSNITQSITQIFTGKELDEEFYDDLTAILLSADMGMEAAEQIIEDIKRTAKKQGIKTEQALKEALAASIAEILTTPSALPRVHPSIKEGNLDSREKSSPPLWRGASEEGGVVILIVGVNGVGKTTAIGKLAAHYKAQKKSVLLAAGDTFRAAASEQLAEWAKRADVRIVKHDQGADPASVVFDALTSARAKDDDITIIDTAGRLHNKGHLMDELKKIDRVARKFTDTPTGVQGVTPCYKKYLVLDATTGQNALTQVEVFNDALDLDGIILTKLDGTAKGGVVIAIKQKFDLPVVFVGVGEKIDDLLPFDAQAFARAIVGLN